MAITFEKEKKPFGVVRLVITIAAALLIIGGAYFLFFAPTPGIEALAPSEQRLASQISKLELNTQPAVEAFTSGRLKKYAGPPITGQVGRLNPFIRF